VCHDEGALLIFDEMVTGFRWHNGGAQKLHGVTPDLSTWGKAMGNGFAVSALAGEREFMRLGGLIILTSRAPCVHYARCVTHAPPPHMTIRTYRQEPVIDHLPAGKR
jgi:glutamate-1-semialdehyde 2,1-aminomutase